MSPAIAGQLEFAEKTTLVYESVTQAGENQFILRIGRFHPDIVLEWESLSHQGTIHFYRRAVEEARRYAVSTLFDPGTDQESGDTMSKWLSRKVLEEALSKGEVKIELNRLPVKFKVVGETTFEIQLNRQPVELKAVSFEDNRRGKWVFLNDPENPVLLEYTNAYYREYLKDVSTTNTMSLRWLKTLPPVK